MTASLEATTPPLVLFAIRFLITLLTTSLVATFTWLYIEETGIRLGRKVIARLEHRPDPKASEIPAPTHELVSPRGSLRDEQF